MRVDHLVARSYLSSSGGWTTRQLDNWTSSEGQIVCGCDGEKQLKRSMKVLKAELLKIILVMIKMYCFNDDDDDAYRDIGGVIMVGWWWWR